MNTALLSLISALLAGVASTWVGLGWLRLAATSLPGQVPASTLLGPVILAAWALGALVAGRCADRPDGRLERMARWLGACALVGLAAPWLLAQAMPAAPVTETWRRVLLGGLPVAPLAFGLGGVLPLCAAVRRGTGVPAARATGAVAAALAAGAALGAWGWVPAQRAGLDPLVLASVALVTAAAVSWCLGLLTTGSGASVAAGADLEPSVGSEPDSVTPHPPRGGLDLLLAAGLGGALLVAGQLALLRVVIQLRGDSMVTTAETFAGLLAGMALGALWMCFPARRVSARGLVALLLGVAGVSLVLPGLLLSDASDGGLAAQVVLLGLPLGLGAGALVTAASRARPDRPLGAWVGQLSSSFAAGGALGWLISGEVFVSTPGLGTGEVLGGMSLAALSAGGLLALWGLRESGRTFASATVLVLLALGCGLAWRAPAASLPWRDAAHETGLLRQLEGPHGVVSLVSTADGRRRLKLDNRSGLSASAAGSVIAQRMGRLAASMHPGATRALLLGLGRGDVLAGLASSTRAHVECIERSAELLALELPAPYAPDTAPRAGTPTVTQGDGRVWVRAHPAAYDLIVVGPRVPGSSGSGDMLSEQFFLSLRGALAPDGVVVLWLPLHQMPWQAFGSVALAYLEAFPSTRLFVASPLSRRPLVALVGGLVDGLPEGALVDELLSSPQASSGPNSAADVFDLYLANAWELGAAFRGAQPSRERSPVAELLSMGRGPDEVFLATTNTRLLADLGGPLDTSSLRGRVLSAQENKRLGVELQARGAALRSLLMARSASIALTDLAPALGDEELGQPGGELPAEPQSPGAESLDDRRQALEARLTAGLLTAWSVFPGHRDGRQALVERVAELSRTDRVLEAGGLLEAVLEIHADGVLGGLMGGVFLQLGYNEQALVMLTQAFSVSPDDKAVLVNLGTAMLFAQRDQEALALLFRARIVLGVTGLPRLQGVALGLLEKLAGSVASAERALELIDAESAWGLCLTRLIDAAGE